jgi:hypothetical protein
MITRGKRILIVIAGVASLVVAATLGVSIVKFNQYRAGAVPIYPAPGHPQVSITSPTQFSQFALGAPIIVEATAFSDSKVMSIELYLGGVFIGEELAPSGGAGFFPAEFLFYPPEPGVYALIARAKGVDELTTTSSPVQIQITPPEFEPAAESDDSIALPVLADSSTPPDLPVPGSDSNPAEPWNGTAGNWINSLTGDAPPNAPELAASLDGCSVRLSIHDLSDNEEGFEVWRLLPNSPAWASVAVLASQSQGEWITTTDSGAHGGTTYYVSAFNGAGVQDSNLASVNLDPVACSPPAAERSALTLELKSLETDLPVDKLYCYVSLDGVSWMRRPEFGFWPRGDVAQEAGFIDTEIVSLNLTPDDSSLGSEINPKTFHLQCWGWLGDSLHYLGEFSPSLLPDQPNRYALGSEGSLAEVVMNLDPYPDQPEFYPMGGAGTDDYELGVFDAGMHEINPWLKPATIDPTMPIPISHITYDPDLCKSHLPPPFQNQFGQFLFCTPYPGFDLGDQGVNPQPYFIWHMSKECLDGKGSPPCNIYEFWLVRAASHGHEMGFNIYDQNDKGFYIHHVNAPELFNFVIPVVPCSGYRSFWVQMWYYDGSSLLPTYGPPTVPISITCPDKLWPKMYLDISFDTLKLSNVDDGDSGTQDVEVYGYLRATSESETRYLNFAPWNQQEYGCPDEAFGNLGTSGGMGCPKIFTDGTYNLADVALSQADSIDPWEVDYKFNNNLIRLIIEEYDSLALSVKLVDWDDGSDNDLVCQATIHFPSLSIFDWYKVKNQGFTIIGTLSDGTACQIEGVMNSITPGYE